MPRQAFAVADDVASKIRKWKQEWSSRVHLNNTEPGRYRSRYYCNS